MDNELRDAKTIERLEARVSALEEALDALYRQVGKSVVNQAELASKEADRLTDALLRAKKHLMALRGDIRCAVCQSPNPAKSNHCAYCGAKLLFERNDDASHTKS